MSLTFRKALALTLLTFSSRALAYSFRSSKVFMSSKATGAASKVINVLVPIANGSEEIESVTIIDTLVRGGATVTVASVENSVHVVCSRGVKISADTLIESCCNQSWDLIALPGGMPGSERLRDSEILVKILKKQNDERKPIAAMCASPAMVLASKGFLTGKHATCYPAKRFRDMLEKPSDDQIVIDGNIITSQGPGDSIYFALKLIEILFGLEKRNAVANEMLVK